MPHFEQACLDRAWPILCQIVAMLTVGLQKVEPGTPELLRLRHLVRLGESMMRRWLLVSALSKGVQPPPSFSSMPAQAGIVGERETGLQKAHSIKAYRFRLLEPERKTRPSAHTAPFGSGPRLIWLDQMRHLDPPIPDPLEPTLTALRRRCAALRAVIEDPKKHVQRMARWLARAAKTCRRIFPLRVGDPPGASHHQRRKDPERQSMLSALNNLSWELRYRKQSP